MSRATTKVVFRSLLVACSLMLAAAAHAGMQEAREAYKRGEYLAALNAFAPYADAGNPIAQYYFGLALENGQGVPKNLALAALWYRKAAEQGQMHAQLNLGVMYESNIGVAIDYKQAAMWYRKAADQGSAAAQFNLGLMYYVGHTGIPRDFREAAMWYRKAADQGNAVAQLSLGRMYENGQAFPVDWVQAYKWYTLSAAAGNETAQQCLKEAENKLSPEQKEDARKLIAEWQASHK